MRKNHFTIDETLGQDNNADVLMFDENAPKGEQVVVLVFTTTGPIRLNFGSYTAVTIFADLIKQKANFLFDEAYDGRDRPNEGI